LEDEGEFDPSALSPLLQCLSIVIENKRSRKQNRKFEILELTSTPGSDEAFKTNDHFRRTFGVNFEVRLFKCSFETLFHLNLSSGYK
jgi:ribosome maturation factor RimP